LDYPGILVAKSAAAVLRAGVRTRLSTVLSCLVLAASPAAHAALGETESEIARRFGRPDPLLQQGSQRNVTLWAIETPQSERLVYTVTFNAKGHSMGEGLKPVRRAVLTNDYAQSFVDSQLAMHPTATPESTLQPKPGEKYTFAGQEFACAANEKVWVDAAHDFLIVWVQGPKGHVLAVRAEMLGGAR
jgi:hypothetical protein